MRQGALAALAVMVVLAAAWRAGPHISQAATYEGLLSVFWIDPSADNSGEVPVYALHADDGALYRLVVDDALSAAMRAAVGGRVRVIGDESTFGAEPAIVVQSVESMGAPPPPPLDGNHPFIIVRCEFPDVVAELAEPSYYEGLFGADYPGLDYYWREASYGNINVAGSSVAPQSYAMPQPRSFYGITDDDAQLGIGYVVSLLNDCAQAAQADVNFHPYTGIAAMFNADIGCCAIGGLSPVNVNGELGLYGFTLMPPWAWQNQRVMAHETGHSFFMQHSSGPYEDDSSAPLGSTYDSNWDVMSGSNCANFHATYGCLGVHPIAYHKDQDGWIPPSQRIESTCTSNTDVTIRLERLALPTTSDYLIARVPIQGSITQFYTVEARLHAGFDIAIPADAVIIHKVDFGFPGGNGRIAYVVDPDVNGNPNDAAAQWQPGETFTDPAFGISVSVLAKDATGYTVRIVHDCSATPTPTASPTPSPTPTVTPTPTSQPDTDADGIPDALDPDDDNDGYEDEDDASPLLFCATMRADVDHDGSVSIFDLANVAGAFGQSIPPAEERLNQDGDASISIFDLAAVAGEFGGNVAACP